MNTFFLIIKKYFKITDNSLQNLDSLQKIIFFMLVNKKDSYSIKNKFKYFLHEINNIFLTEEQKEDFINIFCIIQKTYFALSRFAYIYKYKKAKIVVDVDLCLNHIDINNKNSICLFQEKNRYYFRINDLINIIDNALSNSPNFFSDPLIIKNPYNNMPFNKSTLYNIYFNIITKTSIVPELIHKFFISNFDLDKFENDYEYLIREHSIYNYVKNSSVNTLYISVFVMIESYNDNDNYTDYYSDNYNDKNKILIHKDFPKKKLVEIMRPYLLVYFLYKYSLINTQKHNSKILLFEKLKQFNRFNPFFGRKQIKVEKYISNNNIKYKNLCSYNDKYIDFYKEDNFFLTSHLSDE
jgi:hypothetical protein